MKKIWDIFPAFIEMKKLIIAVILLVILFMIGGHLLDIGDVVYDHNKRIKRLIDENDLNNKYGNGEAITTNGLFNMDANTTYHIGYYLMYLCFFVMVILYVNLLFNKSNQK